MKTVVAVDFAPPRPARHGRRRLLLAGVVAALAALLVAGALVTQLLLR